MLHKPCAASMQRDQLIAAMARSKLWLTDAYYAGTTSYVQALGSAARDGVDVRLLVPNATDIPLLKPLSRSGYRPLLEAGVRIFEWNGTMIHAKTAVADGRWARVGIQLGQVLKNIYIPDDVLLNLNNSLTQEQMSSRSEKKQQRERLQHRLSSVLRHIDQSYLDKLDGKIEEDFWRKKTSEWRMEEQQIQMAIQGLEQANPDQLLTAKRTLELANKAYFLYVTQTPAEKGKLLKMVLSNCGFDGVTLYPTYRKPFDLIFQRAKSEEWCARRDSNSRPVAPEATALSS